MRVVICRTPASAGDLGAAVVAARLNEVLAGRERARLLLSTGESQFETLRSLVRRPVEWERVDAFHLDEYVALPPEHPASFRRYLDERVSSVVPLRMHHVDPSSPGELDRLSETVAESPMDVALIGIGQNGHIAFNDPPTSAQRRPTSRSSSTQRAALSRCAKAGSRPTPTCRSEPSRCRSTRSCAVSRSSRWSLTRRRHRRYGGS